MNNFKINSKNVNYSEKYINSKYSYDITKIEDRDGILNVSPESVDMEFETERVIPKTGLMIIGWGGNNGSTLTGGIVANRLGMTWKTKTKTMKSDYLGSFTQSSTTLLGVDSSGKEIYIPMKELLPMTNPNDLIIGGWDISSSDISKSCERAQVFEPELQTKLRPYLRKMKPLPSPYFPDFIASNQEDRADNIMTGDKKECLCKIRKDIKDFKFENELDKVIVVWSGNTERFSDVRKGLNKTATDLVCSIDRNEEEISPSTLFAVACILENTPYINCSPQNTFVPGCIELAEKHNSIIIGDDLKTGQTKLKSVLIDFLVSAGIKPTCVTSYNHLGNNDGKNLDSQKQFRSKEITKMNVIDDMVESNKILYEKDEHPDHKIVIKYQPYVGDSKRAMDEYVSEIFMGGTNTLVIHNTCEDSLLAVPLILDLVILTELFGRIKYRTTGEFKSFHPVFSMLSYFMKAPLSKGSFPVVNSLFRQKYCIENILRACIGLKPLNHMRLETLCNGV